MASAALFFSLTFVIVRHLSFSIEAFEQTFFRHVIGILILLPFVIQPGLTSLKTHRIGLNIVRNFAGNAGMSLSFLSMTLIPLGEAVTLHFSLPFFVILFAILILREQVGIHRWMAMVIEPVLTPWLTAAIMLLAFWALCVKRHLSPRWQVP